MNKARISIIMGIYNCAETLSDAIDSILSQTFTDWKLIMCDDGSTDNTYEIADKYRKRYASKIMLIKNPKNMGLNYTLNICLKYADGEYIARMDADDLSLPSRFEKEIEFMDKNQQYAIVSTPMFFFDQQGIWGKGTAIEVPELSDFVFHAPFHCHAPCMIRTAAILDVGGYTVDKMLLRYEDCNLWYKLYSAGYRGYNLQEPLYIMRDDRNAYKRRTFFSRMRAIYVQWIGFRMIKMPIIYYLFLIVELIKGIFVSVIPEQIYMMLHRHKAKS